MVVTEGVDELHGNSKVRELPLYVLVNRSPGDETRHH